MEMALETLRSAPQQVDGRSGRMLMGSDGCCEDPEDGYPPWTTVHSTTHLQRHC